MTRWIELLGYAIALVAISVGGAMLGEPLIVFPAMIGIVPWAIHRLPFWDC